ncbi:hypothetical protein Pint_05881 [Pistacia integerrima]|uniref:Uncharacterized protein n=1 Tax=Pistacia integerrima TaxID=434235 RepID=A0ACC0Z886_9ROSI|nr:hypothetical protein Pint_05881 [Pistacia integerrima]
MADDINNQYGLPDLGQLVSGRTHFPANPQAAESYLFHRNHQHETVMLPGGLVSFGQDHHHNNFSGANISCNTSVSGAAASGSAHSSRYGGVDMESGGWSFGNEGGNCRWPRQETLTLLEIRSRLDSKFKEANQKKPLWDEVSRIMAEEHGYHRSDKKCREKFENLYKYYKKTKEGKAGRQDGKNYRFFRQLEALYGETSNNNNNNNNQISLSESHLDHHNHNNSSLLYQTQNNQEAFPDQSLSFSNTSEFETASSENNDNDDLSAIAFMMNQKSLENNKQKGASGGRIKKTWKEKVKEYVDSQMRKLMESQEAWMERMLKTIEDKEQERLCKEEEWRNQEVARFDQVHEFWAKERAWIEARDAVVMEALKQYTGRGFEVSSSSAAAKKIPINKWSEPETSCLVQLVTKFQENGYSDENLWEEIAAQMASLGYFRSATEYKEKWEKMKMYFNLATEGNKKQRLESMDLSASSYGGTQVFHMVGNEDEENLWEKGKNHHQERENLRFSP